MPGAAASKQWGSYHTRNSKIAIFQLIKGHHSSTEKALKVKKCFNKLPNIIIHNIHSIIPVASFLWPLNVCTSSFMLRISNNLMR